MSTLSLVEVLGQLLAEKSQYDVVCWNFERRLPIWLVEEGEVGSVDLPLSARAKGSRPSHSGLLSGSWPLTPLY